jgi:purine-cytosine permease-like protein
VYLSWWSLHGQHPVALWHRGGAHAFWPGFDLVLASIISWTPLVADYTRFSRTRAAGFWSAGAGYFIPTVPLFALGAVIALSRHISDAPGLLTAVAAGGAASVLALLALTVDESDEAFANVYSGAVSLQNLVPRVPQRMLVAGVAAAATVGALVIDLRNYQPFLYLLGSFFVPLFAVLLADWLLAGRHYDAEHVFRAPGVRIEMVAAWLAGFCLYQWLYPQGPSWWTDLVAHTHPHALPWGGASIPSFAAAFGLAAIARLLARRPILASA